MNMHDLVGGINRADALQFSETHPLAAAHRRTLLGLVGYPGHEAAVLRSAEAILSLWRRDRNARGLYA